MANLIRYTLNWEIETNNPNEIREMNILHESFVQAVREQGHIMANLRGLVASHPVTTLAMTFNDKPKLPQESA